MKSYDSDLLNSTIATDNYFLKLLANESAVYFFAGSIQHRDAKQPGLNYEHDSKGNAIAGILRPGLLEFRFHKDFSEERVTNIAQTILNHPQLNLVRGIAVTYQGNQLLL